MKGQIMSGTFLKFKIRHNLIRIIRALMVGLSAGMLFGGAYLLFWKLTTTELNPLLSLAIGGGAFLLFGGLVFLISGKSDKTLAEELDSKFGLKARIQTMVAYSGESDDMLSMQREDAERALSKIPVKSYKFKGLWIFILVFVISAAPLVGGLIVKDVRGYVPPEPVVPFELSRVQEQGINELINRVEKSSLEEEFKLPMIAELKSLLSRLKEIDTDSEMRQTLSQSMANIAAITYESSTATEVLNALWDSKDINLRYLAVALDTSEWTDPDWAAFAEGLQEYSLVLRGEGKENVDTKAHIKSSIDIMLINIDPALKSAGLGEDDEIIVAIGNLFHANPGGLEVLLYSIDSKSEEDAIVSLDLCLNLNGTALYDAISLNKVNANEGEHVLTRLSILFGVASPEFERPEFVKNGETPEGGLGGDGTANDDDKKPSDGGVGKGEQFGSDDLVLDPLTGELKKYGDLIHKYDAIMYEKLGSDLYTEEQKAIIMKYFEMLYSGIKKQEGN